MKQWYAVHTKPRSEYRTATELRGRGIETYLPEIEAPTRLKGRVKRPFFPCYLFARVDFEMTRLSQLQWTPGLRRFVAFDGRPVPVTDDVINLMRRKLDGNGAGGRLAHDFRPGESVRITDGPLQGILAIFEGPSTPSERVQVLLTFLGGVRRIQVPTTDLEKAVAQGESLPSGRPRRTRGRGRRIKCN